MRLYLKDLYYQFRWQWLLLLSILPFSSLIEGLSFLFFIPLFIASGIREHTVVQNSNVSYWLVSHIHLNFVQSLFIFVLMLAGASLLRMLQVKIFSTIENGFSKNLRNSLYHDFLYAKWQFLQKYHKGEFAEFLTQKTYQVTYMNRQVLQLITGLSTFVIYLTLCFVISARDLCIVITLITTILLISKSRFKEGLYDHGAKLHKSWQTIQKFVHEHLLGMKVAKCYNMETHNLNQFSGINNILYTQEKDFQLVQAKKRMFYEITSVIVLGGIFYLLLRVLHQPMITITLLFFIFLRISPSMVILQQSYQTLKSFLPIYDALMEVQKEAKKEQEKPEREEQITLQHHIRLENLCFSYQHHSVLNNISLLIPTKTFNVIIGESGAGKSTLADIMAGLLLPTNGKILIDDFTLNENNYLNWRKKVALVTQEAFLFNDTLEANLRLVNPEATSEEIQEALRMSNCLSVIEKLPLGMNTRVGDSGVQLSGGEKQRLVLARAILSKPELLILDEITSFLDHKNIQHILGTLQKLKQSMTIIFITHQMFIARHADKIFEFNQGNLIHEGTCENIFAFKHDFFNAERV